MEKGRLEASGLKCDTPGCDYHDDTPEEEYINSIGKPCPKCGASLLTQENYDAFVSLKARLEQHYEDMEGFSQEDIENIAKVQLKEAGFSEQEAEELLVALEELQKEGKELVMSMNCTPDGKIEITGLSEREQKKE